MYEVSPAFKLCVEQGPIPFLMEMLKKRFWFTNVLKLAQHRNSRDSGIPEHQKTAETKVPTPQFPWQSGKIREFPEEFSIYMVSHEEMLISLWILPSCHQGGFWGSLVLDPVKTINCQGKKQAKKTSVSLWFLSKLDAFTETAAVSVTVQCVS